MEPLYRTDRTELYLGDALMVLRELPPSSVDAVITDPPYSSGGMVRGDRLAPVHVKYTQTDSVTGHQLIPFTGDTRDQRGHTYWCALWLAEARRVTTPGGIAAVFTDWRQLPAATDAMQAAGWVWRGIAVWHKPNGRQTAGRFANHNEYLVWGTNGPRSLDVLPYALPGLLSVPTMRANAGKLHITQKPVEVMRWLVRVVPRGGVVLDPFTGSGTTGVAALAEDRRFVGIEIDPHWAAVTADRLADVSLRSREEVLW